jgi:hypothetical protein
MKLTSNIGFIVLAIYLMLLGIVSIVPSLAIPSLVFGLIALIAGIFILLGK